jgi:hypothetical protein
MESKLHHSPQVCMFAMEVIQMQINRSISYTRSWKSTLLIAMILSAVFCFVLVFLQPFDTYNVEMAL